MYDWGFFSNFSIAKFRKCIVTKEKRSNVRDSDAQIEVSHNTISLSSH